MARRRSTIPKAQLDSAAVELESAKATMLKANRSWQAVAPSESVRLNSPTSVRRRKRHWLRHAAIDEGWAQYHTAMQTREMLNNKLDEAQRGLDQVNDGLTRVAAGINQAQQAIDGCRWRLRTYR